jgi:ABC-type Zn uptake system ZnuABC Zn-binding protein ZnuA
MRKAAANACILLCILVLVGCGSGPEGGGQAPIENILVVESFLADITQNVAGERLKVETLIPPGLDPHTFEPTPRDVALIANSQVLIANGSGLEEWLQEVLDNAGGEGLVMEASEGLSEESPRPDDPHYWLDPNFAIRYVENIRDGLSQVDPDGQQIYAGNATAYIAQLEELNDWIEAQVERIDPGRRILITNHESFGYFADRYGFEVVGTIVPSVSTNASPSAQQLVQLVEAIQRTGAPAIFLESGTNPKLAEQVAREAGVFVIKDLHSHSSSSTESYIEMMKYNTQTIVAALQ